MEENVQEIVIVEKSDSLSNLLAKTVNEKKTTFSTEKKQF